MGFSLRCYQCGGSKILDQKRICDNNRAFEINLCEFVSVKCEVVHRFCRVLLRAHCTHTSTLSAFIRLCAPITIPIFTYTRYKAICRLPCRANTTKNFMIYFCFLLLSIQRHRRTSQQLQVQRCCWRFFHSNVFIYVFRWVCVCVCRS